MPYILFYFSFMCYNQAKQRIINILKVKLMNKQDILKYAEDHFGSAPEYLWAKYPTYCVLRHPNNHKWYAVLMDVAKNKLGLSGDENVDILVIKCGPILLGSLLLNKGFLPAYHMNKSNWVTVLLDGSVAGKEIAELLEISYDMTSEKL